MILNIPNQNNLSGFYIIYDNVISNENEGTYGIGHLIEHLICKNLKDDFVNILENNGIVWNAYTTPNNIVFYIKGIDDYIFRYKDDFYNTITNFNTTEKLLESEKKIVIEEYTDLFNRFNKNHFLNLYRKLFNNYNSIGEKSNIENVTVDDCYKHYNNFYKTPHKILYFSKNYKHESNIKFNENNKEIGFKYISNNKYILESPISSINKSSVIYTSPIVYSDFDKIIFINYLLSGGLKSPLYKAIREKENLAYYINCRIDRLHDTGVIIISTETNDNNVEKLHQTIINIFKDKNYLTKEKFNIIKNFIKINIIKSNINIQDNEDEFILPESWKIENTIDTITYDNIIEIFEKYFNIESFYNSVNKIEFY